MTPPIDRDGALVAALRRGDPTAAEDLVAAYGDLACRLATRITRNAQDAEEAVQDAFLSVIRKMRYTTTTDDPSQAAPARRR